MFNIKDSFISKHLLAILSLVIQNGLSQSNLLHLLIVQKWTEHFKLLGISKPTLPDFLAGVHGVVTPVANQEVTLRLCSRRSEKFTGIAKISLPDISMLSSRKKFVDCILLHDLPQYLTATEWSIDMLENASRLAHSPTAILTIKDMYCYYGFSESQTPYFGRMPVTTPVRNYLKGLGITGLSKCATDYLHYRLAEELGVSSQTVNTFLWLGGYGKKVVENNGILSLA